ncbi:hypothetical protein DRN85_00570 [Methanosarcinales archaeon]|nr:MAG: hypothetical protein DRN85_00570 [Methanosarcinales archaeon]
MVLYRKMSIQFCKISNYETSLSKRGGVAGAKQGRSIAYIASGELWENSILCVQADAISEKEKPLERFMFSVRLILRCDGYD